MKRNILLSLLLFLNIIPHLQAVPAKFGQLKFSQPDGSVVTLCKTGDERAHMLLSPEGYPVAKDAAGYYCFATQDGSGLLTPTSVNVKPFAQLQSGEREIVETIERDLTRATLNSRSESSKLKAAARIASRAPGGIGLMDDALLGRKELRGLVILAEYQDVKFAEGSDQAFFEEMLNSEGFAKYGATGSARDYFIDSSTGQFIPEFDVYGPVTLPQNMAYYGGNDPRGDDKNPARMIYDACVGLDDEINFADYDLDGDGIVENVFVFYAGYGEASYGKDDSVWPHQWALSGASLKLQLDGVSIDKYACSNELELDGSSKPVPCGIGTFVHEFSHVLGLPDLYDTATGGYWTPATWSVLDQGPYNNDGRTPPAYSAYERYSLGWLEPQVLSEPDLITLEAITGSNTACIIQTDNENEFFLLENRQQEGWDSYLPGHGMLIWHIDYNKSMWWSNKVNTRSTHNFVDIEEAGGKCYSITDFMSYAAYYRALAEYAFPGPKNVTSFTDDTTPSMRTWADKALSLPITDIMENDGVISFKVAGGRCYAAVPEIKAPSRIGADWFEAAWQPADGAMAYQLSVRALPEADEFSEDTVDFGTPSDAIAVLPDGWSYISSMGLVYSSEGYYGTSAPALKLSSNGSGIVSPIYEKNIVGLDFWVRGQLVNSSSKVLVEGLVNGSWQRLDELAPPREAGELYSVANLPAGLRQVRITFKRSAGYVAIDDISVKFNKIATALEGYEAREVGNVTSFVVNELPAGINAFAYKVRAVDEEGNQTQWSEEQIVTMGDNSGHFDIIEGPEEMLVVSGRRIEWQGAQSTVITLTDLCGRNVESVVSDGNGYAVINAPTAGIYILKTSSGAKKVMIR